MTHVTRSPAYLAALASAAVPGLDPASARAVEPHTTAEFDVAFVIDTEDRQWVVRAPRTEAAAARLEASAILLGLLARRLPFHVPAVKGLVPVPQGRAAIYAYLPGRPLHLPALPAGPGLAAELGRTVAAIHNLDRQVYEEAGVPAYDAETYRTRRLADLDRAAATGHVPTRLLSRWENALDDVTLWRFAPTPIHGDLSGRSVLAVFDSDDDATTGHIRSVTGWEDARAADPADDLAVVVAEAPPEAVESVLEAYAHARIERPDPHLRRRARLGSELRLLGRLLVASSAGSVEVVRAVAGSLDRLAHSVGDDDLAPPPPRTVEPKPVAVPVGSPPSGGSREPAGAGTGSEGPGEDDTVGLDPRDVLDETHAIPEHQLAKARSGQLPDDAPGQATGEGSRAAPSQPTPEPTPEPTAEPTVELSDLAAASRAEGEGELDDESLRRPPAPA